jgi:hypothetical protein
VFVVAVKQMHYFYNTHKSRRAKACLGSTNTSDKTLFRFSAATLRVAVFMYFWLPHCITKKFITSPALKGGAIQD